jgi:hypothetical protein
MFYIHQHIFVVSQISAWILIVQACVDRNQGIQRNSGSTFIQVIKILRMLKMTRLLRAVKVTE